MDDLSAEMRAEVLVELWVGKSAAMLGPKLVLLKAFWTVERLDSKLVVCLVEGLEKK